MIMHSHRFNLNVRIPGFRQRRPRVKQAPWVLRHCPDRLRPMAEYVFFIVGFMAGFALIQAALWAMIFVPLLTSRLMHPARPIMTAPIRWLREHFSHDVAFNLYLSLCVFLWAGLFYAWRVFEYLSTEASKRKDANAAAGKEGR